MDGRLMTTAEACKYMRISKSTLYKMTMNREIVFYKPTGGRIYFKKEDLDAFLTRNPITPLE
jgi:putative excisionase